MDDHEIEQMWAKSDLTMVPQFMGTKGMDARIELVRNLLAGLGEMPKKPALIYRCTGTEVATINLSGRIVFGRSSDADFQLDHAFVSRKHFEVECDGMNALLKDLGSVNGVKINDSPVKEKYLVDGDVIDVKPYTFVFINPVEDAQMF